MTKKQARKVRQIKKAIREGRVVYLKGPNGQKCYLEVLDFVGNGQALVAIHESELAKLKG